MKKDEIQASGRADRPPGNAGCLQQFGPSLDAGCAGDHSGDQSRTTPSLIDLQRRRLGTSRGFIVAKPNCSIQSYVPALTPLMDFGLEKISVCTYQAISGAGKTFADWPEMSCNLIPYIGGEEEKSEQEPLKIWGSLSSQGIIKPAAARSSPPSAIGSPSRKAIRPPSPSSLAISRRSKK